MAQINLSVDDRRNLAKWMGFRNIKLSLIYSAARDGWTGEAFHKHCNYRCPLLVVSATESGYVFGGYATMPWVCENTILSAPGSFLFRLKKDDRVDYMKFAGTDYAAVVSNSNYGPQFGDTSMLSQAQFKTFGDPISYPTLCFFNSYVTPHPGQKFVTCSQLSSYFSGGFENNGEDENTALTGGDNRLLNVEVYTVEDRLNKEEETRLLKEIRTELRDKEETRLLEEIRTELCDKKEAKPLEEIRTELCDKEETKLSDEIRTERRKEERKERSRKEEEEIRDKEDGCVGCCDYLRLLGLCRPNNVDIDVTAT